MLLPSYFETLQLDTGHWAAIILAAGKVFLILARSMPEPTPTTNFWGRWLYDFVQLAAENPDRIGKSRVPVLPGSTMRMPAKPDVVVGSAPVSSTPSIAVVESPSANEKNV